MRILSESQIQALRHLEQSPILVSRNDQRWHGLPHGIRTLRTLEQLAHAGLCRSSYDQARQAITFTITRAGRQAISAMEERQDLRQSRSGETAR
ncbi:hypothetical protein LA66_06700 [Aureimonas altamirensis]|uniref:Uncharacterized protein n=1 Tax=Aureimonas altamirensis TaxID=370622 RepID=A0A0B1QBR6_9HYPH|nr:hypothetical protein [Aureimonas altamirensis]KHJ56260.1 hypothetical protein LA66_06700 [Aureimonas altamirensis]